MATQPEKIGRFHDRLAQQGYRTIAEQSSRYGIPLLAKQALRELNLLQPDFEVLDLGCGPGILKDFTPYARYTGVDSSVEMLQEAGETGYQELVEAGIAEYLANPTIPHYDGITALSCMYFLSPEQFLTSLQRIDALAKKFWLITIDELSLAAQAEYTNDKIETYNHAGIVLPWSDCHVYRGFGWYSAQTNEDITAQVIVRVK